MWIASEIGAHAIVFGRVTPSQEKLILSTDLVRIGDEKKLGSSSVELAVTDQLRLMVCQASRLARLC
jgi:hypothetical protein